MLAIRGYRLFTKCRTHDSYTVQSATWHRRAHDRATRTRHAALQLQRIAHFQAICAASHVASKSKCTKLLRSTHVETSKAYHPRMHAVPSPWLLVEQRNLQVYRLLRGSPPRRDYRLDAAYADLGDRAHSECRQRCIITSAMGSSYPGRDRGSPIWMTNELADAQLRLRRQLVGKPLRSSRSRQQAAVRPVHCG